MKTLYYLIGRAYIFLAILLIGFIIAYLLSASPYTPAQITELQQVPLILQGGTDWGGSNIFAAIVLELLCFGLLGCYIFTAKLHFKTSLLLRDSIIILFTFFGFVIFFTCLRWGEIATGRNCEPWDLEDFYYLIDDLGTLVLFALVYLISGVFIYAIRKQNVCVKFLLAPVGVIAALYLGSDGITEKAGQIVNSGAIPIRDIRSWKHRVMLYPRDALTFLSANSLCTDISRYLMAGSYQERGILVGKSLGAPIDCSSKGSNGKSQSRYCT